MIDITEVISIHEILIDKFGGAQGIRDMGLLESSLNRPFATFDQKDLYPTPIDKAAAILESIITNHPFIDGNKRTGYTLTRLFLNENGIDIEATQAQKFEFVIALSKGQITFEEIRNWLNSHQKKL